MLEYPSQKTKQNKTKQNKTPPPKKNKKKKQQQQQQTNKQTKKKKKKGDEEMIKTIARIRGNARISGAGIKEADDRQVTTVFTVQPPFHHRHSTNRVS